MISSGSKDPQIFGYQTSDKQQNQQPDLYIFKPEIENQIEQPNRQTFPTERKLYP
jgi:hypothetical protein